MANGHQAGSLILNQLRTFNDSFIYFEQVLEPALWGGIDLCVEAFCNERDDWSGEFNFTDEENCWLQPLHWIITKGDNDSEDKAFFYFRIINDDVNFYVATLCGLSNTGGEAGFMFKCNNKIYGGKKAWTSHIKKEDKKLEDIISLGFKNMGDGNFFLPVKLDSLLLANTWDEYGKFTNEDECFQPIRDSLDTLAKSVPLFDTLMQNCQPNTK